MTDTSSTPDEVGEVVVADPKDRFLAPLDPLLRNERRRFIAAVIAVCLIHAALLVLLILRGHATPQPPSAEIPVEVVVIPPPPPKPLPKKQEPKPQPKPKKEKPHYEKPATDTPPAANKEKIEREEPDQKSASPLHGNPEPDAQLKPVPDQTKPAQNAAATPAKQTAAPTIPDDKPDAETLSKAAPDKSEKPTQKEKPAKTKTPEPSHERAALEREFAALSQSPHFSIATRAKPSPVSGGQCHTNPYLCTLYGLIMRQQHYPASAKARGLKGKVIVGFWIDDRGDLVHQALYRTSGYPELDRAAVAAVEKAAPFPPPPYGQPHGFVAQMSFPPN